MTKKKHTKESVIEETKEHINDVNYLMIYTTKILLQRGIRHDHTKLKPENAQVLADCLNKERDWKEWKDIHFKQEDHHPEYFHSLFDMNLFQLLEEVIDGCTANYRRTGIMSSRDKQRDYFMEHKGFDEMTATIMANTFIQLQNMLKRKDE